MDHGSQQTKRNPTQYTWICSEHFVSGCKSNNLLAPNYVPSLFKHNTVRVLNFVGKIFVFLVSKKICGVLIFVAMAAW